MHKKLISLALSGILSLSIVGCNNEEEAEYQEPQTKQEEVKPDDNTNSDVEERNDNERSSNEYVPADTEEEVQDEDLTEEYEEETETNDLEETSQTEQLKLAKTILEESAKEHMTGYRYKITTDEESNSVIFILHATSIDVAKGINDGSYNELTDSMLYLSTEAKGAYERLGLDVNCSVCLGDIDNDKIWFGTFNENILYDATDELN